MGCGRVGGPITGFGGTSLMGWLTLHWDFVGASLGAWQGLGAVACSP
jgi:hypothetical protein